MFYRDIILFYTLTRRPLLSDEPFFVSVSFFVPSGSPLNYLLHSQHGVAGACTKADWISFCAFALSELSCVEFGLHGSGAPWRAAGDERERDAWHGTEPN
jgi:hypothetical protein